MTILIPDTNSYIKESTLKKSDTQLVKNSNSTITNSRWTKEHNNNGDIYNCTTLSLLETNDTKLNQNKNDQKFIQDCTENVFILH